MKDLMRTNLIDNLLLEPIDRVIGLLEETQYPIFCEAKAKKNVRGEGEGEKRENGNTYCKI